MTEEQPRPRGVQSVDRALDVLEAIVAADAAVGVTDVARRVDLPQGTAHRLLLALADRGYVRREPDRKYAIGLAAVRLGDAAYRGLGTLARGHLRSLVELTGETANLAVLEGTMMMYAAQSPSPYTLRIFAEVGRRVPIHSTAVGKATLAALPPSEASALVSRLDLVASTPHTLADPESVMAELEHIRADGFAVDEEEQELGVRCVAVALPVVDGLRAAVSVSGPAERFSGTRAREIGSQMPEVLTGMLDGAWSGTRPGAGA